MHPPEVLVNDYTSYHLPGGVITFRTGGRVVRGEAVMPTGDPGNPGRVERWMPGGAYLGIAAHAAPTDDLVAVFPAGAVQSGLADGPVTEGDLVEVSGTTGRQVRAAAPFSHADGVALTAAADGAMVFWMQRPVGPEPAPPPPPPNVQTVLPTNGPEAGGTNITIVGQNFTGATGATIGGAPVTSFTVVGVSGITGVSPPGPPGPADVAVISPNGPSTGGAGMFTYNPTPPPPIVAVDSVTPNEGPAGGGMGVTIAGAGFTGTDPAGGVTFGGVPATLVTVDSDTSILCAIPAGPAGQAVDVQVTSPSGTGTLPGGFTYQLPANPTAVTPDRGPDAGGAPVTITGTGFTGSGNVLFGTAPATSRVVVSDTTITCTTPAHAAGLVNVTVAKTGGNGILPGGYTYEPPPVLDQVDPDTGSAAGDEPVQLAGTGFTLPLAVRFGAADSAQTAVISPTQAACTTPPGTPGATVDVTVTCAGGSSTRPGGFTYDAPRARQATPRSAPKPKAPRPPRGGKAR
jgi:IPT/TIG domain-containing protein